VITAEDLMDPDEDGAVGRQRFEELQARAQNAGHELRRTASGFLLQHGTASRHTPDLEVIAALLKRRPAAGDSTTQRATS
jgi:hypothetical protein